MLHAPETLWKPSVLCLPENYIDVPQDGRGRTRLQGAAFKKINSITKAEENMDK